MHQMDEFQQTLINDFNQALQDNSVLETVAKYQAGVWRDPEGVVSYFVPHQGKVYYLIQTNEQSFLVEKVFCHGR